jgi:plasmid stability protein
MYAHTMKRLQIMIDEDLDADLEHRAAREGTSKAALIRQIVRDALHPAPALQDDPIWDMAGADDFEPAGIDDVVYR